MALSKNSTFTHRQLQALHCAARAAFAKIGGDSAHGPFDEWRRATIQDITGFTGFSQCRQSHYSSLMAHFSHLQGRDAEAFRSHMRAGTETEVHQAQTAWHLDRAARELGYYLDPHNPVDAGRAYALRIAQDQHAKALHTWEVLLSLDHGFLTRLTYTLRNRRKALEQKAISEADAAEFEPESTLAAAPF